MKRFGGALAALSGMVSRASNQVATVVVTLVATRVLSPTDFGVFALASIAVTLIRTILHTGAFEYLLKAPDAKMCSSECLAVNMLLATTLSFVLGAAVIGAIGVFGPSPVSSIMLIMIPSNLIAGFGAWREALLLRTGRLTLYYGMTMVTEIASAAIAIGLLLHGFMVYALVCQVYARNIIILALYSSTGRLEMSRRFQAAKFRELVRWSSSRYASILLGFGANYGADVFLGIFLSPAATGLYRASSRLITAVSDVFTQPIKMIAMTTFSARAAKGQTSNATWPAMFAVIAAGGGSVLVGVAVVAHQIVPLLLGEQWSKAAALLPILAVVRAASLLDAVTGPLLVAYDHQKTTLRVQVAASLVGLVFLAGAAPFGLVPATLAVVTAGVVGSAIITTVTCRLIRPSGTRASTLLLTIFLPGVATLAGALAAQHFAGAAQLRPVPALALAIISGAAAWGIAMLVLRQRVGRLIGLLQA